MSALLQALRKELPEALSEIGGEILLTPRSAPDLEAAFALARTHAGRLRAPGAEARDADLAIDLRFMGRLHSVDEASRIAHVGAGMGSAELEARLRPEELSLGCLAENESLGSWIARGAPGRRPSADDAVDQVLCGAEIMLADGRLLRIRPAPRRAVGPDLLGALLGGRGRVGVALGLHLLVKARVRHTRRTYVFSTLASAESACAWARGRGVRAARLATGTCAEGGGLWAEIAMDEMEEPRLLVLESVCSGHGGTLLPAAGAPPWPSERGGAGPSATLDALAARLDPEHILH